MLLSFLTPSDIAEQPPVADAFQRPLRSRFQARLRRSVRQHILHLRQSMILLGQIFPIFYALEELSDGMARHL